MKDSTVEIVVFEKKKSKLSLQDQDDRLFHQKITEQLLSRGIMPQIKFRQIDIDGPYDFVVGREQGVLHVNTYPSQEADSPSPVQPPQPKSKAQTLMGPSHGTKG